MIESEVERVRQHANTLYSARQLEAVYAQMADDITQRLSKSDPVLTPVMLGGLYLSGMLLPRLGFALELDYLHATRYCGELRGSAMQWKVKPAAELAGRTVLIIDDILDDGLTLHEVVQAVQTAGAAEVLTAVLVIKEKARSVDVKIDFSGVTVPDKYVFGCGMDYKGYWRNLPGIYSVADD
jgi:hypoxanthine phosphoribosyltransferase